MLALSRKTGERILIGDDVILTVLAVRGKQVCLGIEAPKSVNILREELCTAERRAPSPAHAAPAATPSRIARRSELRIHSMAGG